MSKLVNPSPCTIYLVCQAGYEEHWVVCTTLDVVYAVELAIEQIDKLMNSTNKLYLPRNKQFHCAQDVTSDPNEIVRYNLMEGNAYAGQFVNVEKHKILS